MTLFDTGIIPIVNDYLLEQSKEVRSYGKYWSASQSGYCMRKVIFERMGVPHVETEGDARKQRVFSSGHIFHEWLQKLTRDAGVSVAQEVELIDNDLMIKGHFDDLVLIPGKTEGSKEGEIDGQRYYDEWGTMPQLILYDYKTAHSKWFEYAKNQPISHYHRMQLGTYMYMLRKMNYPIRAKYPDVKPSELTEARILKISKDDLRLYEQQVMWSPELEKDVVGYWRTLNGYYQRKQVPNCTCDKYENGFLARPTYNPYFYEGEPCSLKWYLKWKEGKSES